MSPAKVPPASHDIGDLDRTYAVMRELGRGGMGSVLLARHREAGHRVAIKIASTDKFDAETLLRFQREARLMARFRHPNIVRLYDVRPIRTGRVAIVMEYVRGVSLAKFAREGRPLPFDTCIAILRDLGNALAHAHEYGVVHRDVKPHNVLVEEDTGTAKLSDFGIAKVASDDAEVTAVGAVLGTPSYMSPEQIDGRAIDARSDIYSLGVLGWEIVSGEHPWAGNPLFDVLFKQKHESLPSLTTFRPDTPRGILLAIEGALAKDPALRWASMADMLEQLESDEPTAAMLERRDRASAALKMRRQGPSTDAATMPVPWRRKAPPRTAAAIAAGETQPITGEPTGAPTPAPTAPEQRLGRRWRTVLQVAVGALGGGMIVLLALNPSLSRDRGLETSGAQAAPVPAPAVTSDSVVPAPAASPPRVVAAPADVAAAPPVAATSAASTPAPLTEPGDNPPPIQPEPRLAEEPEGESADASLARRASAYAVASRARRLAYAGEATRASTLVDSALSVDPLSSAAYLVRARLRIARGDVRDAWTDIELASRTGSIWESLALSTVLRAHEIGAGAARARLVGELRDALVPRRVLDAERAVWLAVALAQLGDTATALTMLERASPADSRMPLLLADPLLQPLHRSARFAAIQRAASR